MINKRTHTLGDFFLNAVIVFFCTPGDFFRGDFFLNSVIRYAKRPVGTIAYSGERILQRSKPKTTNIAGDARYLCEI